MQARQNTSRHTRAALETLLSWGASERETRVFLKALLPQDGTVQHAADTRAALEELLHWGLEDHEALTFLNAMLRDSGSNEEKLYDWHCLVDASEERMRLEGGGDPGFDDLGEGRYVAADADVALEQAEAALEGLLDKVAGVVHPVQRRAA